MYDVVWADATYDVFTAYWFAAAAPDRERAEAAMYTLNTSLENDPYQVGESRETDEERFTYEPGRPIDFAIDRAAGLVHVSNVRIHR